MAVKLREEPDMVGWLAKERAAAKRQAETDAIAKERMAVAWQRIYDQRAELAEGFRELANMVADYLGGRVGRVALSQSLVDAANVLGQYDYPCPHSLVSAEGTCLMCGQGGIDLTPVDHEVNGGALIDGDRRG